MISSPSLSLSLSPLLVALSIATLEPPAVERRGSGCLPLRRLLIRLRRY